MYEAQLPYETVIERLESIKSTGRIFFTVGNIDYLKHGGRIGKLAGIAGSMLGIRPLITLKEEKFFRLGWQEAARNPLRKYMSYCGSIFKKFMQNRKLIASV